jgi:8-oxo-dGTP pyrophosphatase MutT (NUDIX family)
MLYNKYAACIVIYRNSQTKEVNKSNIEILCVSRKTDHDDFGFVGGKIDDFETPLHAIIRETREETGLDISSTIKEENLIDFSNENEYLVSTYLIEYNKISMGDVYSQENHVIKWINASDLVNNKKFTYYEFNNKIITKYLKGKL